MPTYNLQKSDVNKIKCDDCDAVYFGQTGRSFVIRYNDHIRSWKHIKTDSKFVNHLIKSNHNNIDNLKILYALCFEIKLALSRYENIVDLFLASFSELISRVLTP